MPRSKRKLVEVHGDLVVALLLVFARLRVEDIAHELEIDGNAGHLLLTALVEQGRVIREPEMPALGRRSRPAYVYRVATETGKREIKKSKVMQISVANSHAGETSKCL